MLFWELITDTGDSSKAGVQLFKYILGRLVLMLLKRIKITNANPE
jgi:hypothetical protein